MKKMKRIFALAAALCMICALTACSNGGGKESSAAPSGDAAGTTAAQTEAPSGGGEAAKGAKAAVFYYDFADTYISSVRTALDAELTAAGIDYQNYDAKGSQATQTESINTALVEGCKILVVNLVDTGSSDAAKAIIEMADNNGAQVIFFNRAIEADGDEGSVLGANENICFIGTDAPEAGHLQGKMIGEYLAANYDAVDLNGDGKISYAMMMGQEGNVEAIYRTKYGVEDANAILKGAGKPELVYFDAASKSGYQADMEGKWSAQAGKEYMQTNLSQYNEQNKNMIELVICNNDNMAEGVIAELKDKGYNTGKEGSKTIPVFGVDATQAAQSLIEEGAMAGTVKQDAQGMAKAICGVAKSTAEGNAMTDSVAAVAGSSDIYSVAENVPNKLYVAYAAFTGTK